MKEAECASLARITTFLDNVDVGDYYVHGDLEAYSCKLAGLDKKLSNNLEDTVKESSSPVELSKSPVGPLADPTSRKTLVLLILTLNHIYPDYDFSLLRAHHFRKEDGIATVEAAIDGHLLEVSKVWERTPGYGDAPFLDSIWSAIDEAVEGLRDCAVYSYKAELDSDPFAEDGNVWSFNFFFYNKRRKKILYFSCRGISKAVTGAREDSAGYIVYPDSDSDDGSTRFGMANSMDL